MQIIQKLGEMEAALCSVTVAELVHGIYRADTPERRERRRAFLDELKAAMPVYPITENTAELVGKIGAESSAAGVTIPFDDLPIGACALERGYAVATRNLRHFQKIASLRATDRGASCCIVRSPSTVPQASGKASLRTGFGTRGKLAGLS